MDLLPFKNYIFIRVNRHLQERELQREIIADCITKNQAMCHRFAMSLAKHSFFNGTGCLTDAR